MSRPTVLGAALADGGGSSGCVVQKRRGGDPVLGGLSVYSVGSTQYTPFSQGNT